MKNENMYDYAIVGAGPTGLCLAWYLSKIGKKVIIIEKENTIGGCHRVKRVNGYMTEHGPRIYVGNCVGFKKLLSSMEINFNDLFTLYKFSLFSELKHTLNYFNMREILVLGTKFITFSENDINISVNEFAKSNNFSDNAKWFLDRLCRLTDGAGADRYTLYEFMQLINQNIMYSIFQPKLPTDKGLFYLWKSKLKNNGVEIMLNTNVVKLGNVYKSNKLDKLHVINKNKNKTLEIYADNFILAIPPYNILNLLNSITKLTNKNYSYQLDKWSNYTNYETYIPVIFHWNKKINLKNIWGFPKTDWGVAFIVLSDYMKFSESNSSTVISTSITLHNKSPFINKTPNECKEKKEIIEEVFRQLQIMFNNKLPKYDIGLMEHNYYTNGKWISNDTAFMLTKHGYIENTTLYDNLYTCGAHNGNSNYSFTSIESAVENGTILFNKLHPNKQIKISSIMTFHTVLKIITLIVFVVCIKLVR